MNVSHWVISQGEWSTVDQCEEAKRGFVILYSQWDTAKCLSWDTLGHFCSTNKWDTHTHTHIATHTCINTHRHTRAHTTLESHCSHSCNPHWVFRQSFAVDTKLTELERKRGTRGGREERERKTFKKKTITLLCLNSRHWLMAQGLFFSFC